MADQKAPQMQATLGLTGLTATQWPSSPPAPFFGSPSSSRPPPGTTAPAMWLGIFAALLLCLATAVAYAEISKLYPGTGSSYYYAEQALLSKDKAFKYARVAKFIVGWGSHLYYWVYPGVMVAVTGIFVGYVVGFLYPNFMSGSNPGPVFMALVAVVFSFFVAWIASKGAGASTAVNIAINMIQISALIVFSVLALGYRASHPAGSTGLPVRRADAGHLHLPVRHGQGRLDHARLRAAPAAAAGLGRQAGSLRHHLSRRPTRAATSSPTPTRRRWLAPHKISFVFIQATVAILILVGFESVTSMGGEAKNPTKHIPIAVIASLLIQGLFCYLFEYFAANYFLNSGYTMQSAASSAAPIGDMMIIVGDALLGHGQRQVLHAGRSLHRLPGADRHHAELHEHRRSRDLRDGQGRRGSRALRHPARRVAVAAQGHLDAGRDLRGHRRHRRLAGLRRCRRAHRCGHRGAAARHLLQLRATSRTISWPRCLTRC